MYSKEFEKGFDFVIKWEGEYSNSKDDPGGMTKFGISKRSYPELDISKLTLRQAKEIYYNNYWLKAGCTNMEFPLNIIVFDTAVNMGRSMAKKLLNECFSYDAKENLGIHSWQDYILLRLYTYSEFKQAKLYFRGWANRVLDLYHFIKEKNGSS